MSSNWQQWITKHRIQLRVDAVGISLILAFTLTAYLTVLAPARDGRAAASTNAAHLSVEEARIGQLNNTLLSLRAQRDASRQSFSDALPRLSSAGELNQELAKLTQLASDLDLQIDSMEPDTKPTQTTPFVVTGITISGRGSYQNCDTFVAAIHKKLRDLSVASFGLTSPTTDDPATLSLRLMWYASPAVVANPPPVNRSSAGGVFGAP